MHLRALAIHGFKSFSQRTQLDFEPGITAVVGPNGSGKSNLADAFRWVLGEQSLRALRGRKTEDVLFAGAVGRPPAGMAEVQLIFDTTSPNGQILAIPFAELSIIRRAYRSGENEYYVNRERSRLRDVLDLFGRVGLSLDGFGLVGQGSMDAALSLRAEDRRGLIEQAASISHLHTRLDDARERLEQTRANIARITDLIAEVAPRRDALARQAAQVRERATLGEALDAELLQWFAHQLVSPRRRAQQAEQARGRLQDQKRIVESQRDRAAEGLARARQLTAEEKDNLARAEAEAGAAESESRALTHRVALIAERESGLRHRASQTDEQLTGLRKDLVDEEATVHDFAVEHDALVAQIRTVESELTALEGEAAGWEEEKQRRESELRRTRRRLADLEAQKEAASGRRQAADERLQNLHAARCEREAKRDALRRELDARQTRVSALDEPARRARAELKMKLDERQIRSAEVEVAKANAQEFARLIGQLEREIASVRARVEANRSVEEAGTGYFAGVRAVLQASRGSKARLSGIVGVVAQLLVADLVNELAVETALGGHTQDLVVERWSDAEAAIAFLKASGAGRATFLPLDTVRPSRRHPAPADTGVVGIAAQLVRVDPRYQVIADYLLGQTLIVETLAVARQVLRACPPSWQIVTRDGDLTRASGVVTGGAPAANRGSLSRHRVHREAEAKLATLIDELDRLGHQFAAAQEVEVAATSRFSQTLREVRASEEVVRQADVALGEAQRQLDRASQNLAWHVDELRRLEEQHVTATKVQADARAFEDQAMKALEAVRSQIEAEEAGLALARPPRDLLAAVYDKRAQRDVHVERARAVENARARQEIRLGALREQIRQTEERAQALAGELAALQKERAELADRGTMWRSVVEERAERVRALESTLRDAEERQRTAEAAAERTESAAHKIDAELRDVELAAERAELELTNLQDAILAELGELDVGALAAGTLRVWRSETVVEAPVRPLANPQATRDRIKSLRDRVQLLPSDPSILREFEDVCERVRFLNEQLTDLGRTATTLAEAIDETRGSMRSRFGETFGAVSAAFERRFAELFGGGTARLTLDGDDDLPGVEIFAQPPGKRSQSLAMLSGGERALTAAALLFSLIETNPPPFCVLDEVDAALDENNVARFCAALLGLSRRTQFVVITHNRRTMEVAGAIYGLTLENRGESRVLSLKLPATVATPAGERNPAAIKDADNHGPGEASPSTPAPNPLSSP